MSATPVFKIGDFNFIEDNGLVASIPNDIEFRAEKGFFISYFNGSYIEKFHFKRDQRDGADNLIGFLFHSDNGSRVILLK